MNKGLVIVTGGSSGLGLELVKQLIQKNYFVCNIGRNIEKMKALDNTYKDNYKGFVGDITDEKFVNSTITEISKLGDIKILINNAGEATFKLPTEYKKEDIDKCFRALQGMILCSVQTLKVKEEKNLKIVNIMSSAALRGNKQESVYCAAKWGQRGYTESLKTAYKGTSVKVIGVYPGGMNTEFYTDNRDYVSQEKQNTFMNPVEVAKTIIDNITSEVNLTVADLVIERN